MNAHLVESCSKARKSKTWCCVVRIASAIFLNLEKGKLGIKLKHLSLFKSPSGAACLMILPPIPMWQSVPGGIESPPAMPIRTIFQRLQLASFGSPHQKAMRLAQYKCFDPSTFRASSGSSPEGHPERAPLMGRVEGLKRFGLFFCNPDLNLQL